MHDPQNKVIWYQDDNLILFSEYQKIRVLVASSGYFVADTGDKLGAQVEILIPVGAKYGYKSNYSYIDQFDEHHNHIARWKITFFGAELDEEFTHALKQG